MKKVSFIQSVPTQKAQYISRWLLWTGSSCIAALLAIISYSYFQWSISRTLSQEINRLQTELSSFETTATQEQKNRETVAQLKQHISRLMRYETAPKNPASFLALLHQYTGAALQTVAVTKNRFTCTVLCANTRHAYWVLHTLSRTPQVKAITLKSVQMQGKKLIATYEGDGQIR